jgi:uncharacterized membrane protein
VKPETEEAGTIAKLPPLARNKGRGPAFCLLRRCIRPAPVLRFTRRFAHAPSASAFSLSGRNIVVALTADTRGARPIHPLFAFLLSAAVPLFLGALLNDITYGNTAEPQWANFASWLLVGAMVFTGLALLWALIALIFARPRWGWVLLCFVLLLATFVIGLIDNFQHAKDAWAIMPAATILSLITTLIAALAAAVGLSTLRMRDVK